MLAFLIRWSIQNRFLVLMATGLLAAWGIHATLATPLDALPDLSDTQVIIRTEFPGQAPQVVEDHNLSIASAIGFIALAGASAEFGVVMLIYLDHAMARRVAANHFNTETDLIEAIGEGALMRVRPKAMTVTVIIAGLLPIMFGGGTGSEVMRRIAAPMVGGMITAPMLSMLVLPAAYLLLHRRDMRRRSGAPT